MKSATLCIAIALSLVHVVPAQEIARQYDRATDFSRFHSFKWVAIAGKSNVSSITAANIRSAVNTELESKGLALATSVQPADIYVGYQASVNQQQELSWYNSGGYWAGGMGWAATTRVNVGTLVIDFYNPATKQLVWRGRA